MYQKQIAMFPEFKNLKEVIKNYSDDKTCRALLEMKRWNGTPVCPHCGADKFYKLNDGKTYKCGNKECYKKYTVTVGTIFENTNIPLSTWFAACYIVTAHKKGISSVQLAKDLGVTQKSSWFMIHRIREMVGEKNPEALDGIVEIDETYMSRKFGSKYQAISPEESGRMESATKKRNMGAVIGMKQRGGDVRLQAVDTTTAQAIGNTVIENVSSDVQLMSDESLKYRKVLRGYKRESVNHSNKEWVRGDVHTNGIENFWSVMKRGIYGTYHQISSKHLQSYCDEFSFRFNSRGLKDGERFSLTLSNIEGRLSYKNLISK